MRTFEYKPEWRNWQTRLTQNQVLRSVGSSPTSGTNAQAAGKFEAFPPLFCIHPTFSVPTLHANFYARPRIRYGNDEDARRDTRNRRPAVRIHDRAAVSMHRVVSIHRAVCSGN